MLARLGVGAGVGAVPAAAGIAGAIEGWSPSLVAGFALTALTAMLVVPLAPYVPVLNRVPVIGSPTFRVVLRLNGHLDMRVHVGEWANTSVLEVGVKNLGRSAVVKDVWINVLIPSGIRIGLCDKVGQPRDVGTWEPFHPHRLGRHPRCDYWNVHEWVFSARLSRVLRFKLRLPPSAGEYPILFKLGAPNLFHDVEVSGTIQVEDAAESELQTLDQMGALITKGEQLIAEYEGVVKPTSDDDSPLRQAVMAFAAASEPVLVSALPPNERLPQTPVDADQTELLHHVRETLDALYVLRDERGRRLS